jgi:transcriptional regulator with XRE-family HTH domain
MSTTQIGNNIKKIRGVKNLNQSDFADLFDLKRASIGAYEEGRAEPKIGTILQIANHFGISVDELLTKELSVNDLLRFDIFKDELQAQAKSNLVPSRDFIEPLAIPLINKSNKKRFYANEIKKEALPSIQLPLAKGKDYLAFEIEDNAMINSLGGTEAEDIIVGCRPHPFNLSQTEEDHLYIFELDDGFLFRRLVSRNKTSIELKPDNTNHYKKVLGIKDIKQVWQVCLCITKNVSNRNPIETRLQRLETQFKQLKKT